MNCFLRLLFIDKMHIFKKYVIFMLSPKLTKFCKYQKGSTGGIKSNTTTLQFGQYGLKTLISGKITAKTIETRYYQKVQKKWKRLDINISRYSSYTKAFGS